MVCALCAIAGAAYAVQHFGIRAFIGPAARTLTNRSFQSTPQRVARGKYLVEGVGHCFNCHSPFDENSKTGEPHAGEAGIGDSFSPSPGTMWIFPNLTPDAETGIGRLTDDQLARAIREGISHDGKAMWPMMPYRFFRSMSDEDLASVICFLRSLPPVRHRLPERKFPWTDQARHNRLPQPLLAAVPEPDLGNQLKRGEYYVTLGKCADCHSPSDDDGQALPGLELSGGNYFGEIKKASPHLTNDATGISYYDADTFIRVMRTGKVGARSLSPLMPWWYVGHMTDDDLQAMFAYLQSLKPVHHRVDNDLPPTFCRLCRMKHGGGDQN
jgi:mono/diheme cytochrome c family protein